MSKPIIPLGELIDESQERDAIHVAIAPVIANGRLAPGQPIGFVQEDNQELVGITDKPIGIVDPFLTAMVFEGQSFWMMLFPNTITSLRHNWSHPAFERSVKSISEEWLRRFAETAGLSYDRMIEIVTDYSESGDPWVEVGSEIAQNTWYEINQAEFWQHFERVTGIKRERDDFNEPFSCAC